jgi:heptosyltransferase III
MNDQPKVALVSFDSLGDSLIYLMMAENLRLNGYLLTLYSNVADQIKHWLPNLTINPYPASDMDSELNGYDLVIMSPPSYLRRQMTEETIQEMRQKWLLICQSTPSSWQFDHTERLKSTLIPEQFSRIQNLTNCSGSIRYKEFLHENVVEMTLQFMKEKMQLQVLTKSVALSPPPNLQHRRFKKRIIVSPDSAGPEYKNWSPNRYIKLCQQLKLKGYDPHIVVAPKHHETWQLIQGNHFETPIFQNINDLASYIYESGALIANDSGNGHLASFLNIPVVTIYRKRNRFFYWRPSWSQGRVVCPVLTLPWFGGKKIWKPFVRHVSVIQSLEEIL